ncbi:hypothetical protein QKC54_gp0374 [Megavirus baoshan]|uniref:Uncharacterized protein n=1 Tax=Megavirus baoshan TaxID=2496520 RepID=A0A3S8UXG3_9VIRU|nr:hypothetical protein QKC54_gp0374 [Megavirus baoshan]AZL89451.1 hypothetical protein Mb0698 [Megavirus baoshan]
MEKYNQYQNTSPIEIQHYDKSLQKINQQEFINKLKISFVRIESSQRQKNIIDKYSKLDNLQPYALSFTNNSSIITINMINHDFKKGEYVSLNNIVSKTVLLSNVFSVKKNSHYLRINHNGHGMSYYGTFDPLNPRHFTMVEYVDKLPQKYSENDIIPDTYNQYYVCTKTDINLEISISNVSDNYSKSIGNMFMNYLTSIKHRVYLLFTQINGHFKHDGNNYLIKLDKKSLINYNDSFNFMNTVCIKYYHLYGIPISLFENNHTNYFNVISNDKNSFDIDIKHKAIVDPEYSFYNFKDIIGDEIDFGNVIKYNMGGGPSPYVRKIIERNTGYPNPNQYTYQLDREYNNIIEARITDIVFANFYKQITNKNNKIYWKNLDDKTIHQATIDPGNYSLDELISTIQFSMNSVPYSNNINRKYDDKGNYMYHIFDIKINKDTNMINISSYKEIELIQFYLNDPVIYIPNKMIIIKNVPNIVNILKNTNNIYFGTNNHANPQICNNVYKMSLVKDNIIGKLESNIKFLVNILSDIYSFNTSTTFINFDYNSNKINLMQHNLNIGDFIVTDKIKNKHIDNGVHIYQITSIDNIDNFHIKECSINDFKFIFNDIIINSLNNITPNLTEQNNIFFNNLEPMYCQNDVAIIKHPNHELTIGTNIIINGSNDIDNTPASIINSEHIIDNIIDSDRYSIKLGKYNPIQSNNKYVCFNNIRIKYPNKFMLLLEEPDNLNQILGFVDMCTYTNSIIEKYEISNVTKNHNNYFYITCKNFGCFENTKPVSDVFAIVKLNETTRNNKYLSESLISHPKIFDTPLNSLNKLDIEMYYPNGELVDFFGTEHMFIMEIKEVISQLNTTNIKENNNTMIVPQKIA